MTPCECEHEKHFDSDAHAYGAEFDLKDMIQMHDEYGTFCAKCADTCLAFLKEESND